MGMDTRVDTAVITGGSKGIGLAIAEAFAADGVNVAIAGRDEAALADAEARLSKLKGGVLVARMDVRDYASVDRLMQDAAAKFGGIDVLVNNASAISVTGTLETPMKRFDLMHGVNTRGTFACSQACIPHLARAANPHILNLSPPLNMEPRWFGPHVAYTMAKFGMSMCVLGMAEEFRGDGIAVNALWPQTVIATAAVQNLLGGDEVVRRSRKPEIVADAAHAILTKPSREFTGRFCIDEQVLRDEGVEDFSHYAVDPELDELIPDFFI